MFITLFSESSRTVSPLCVSAVSLKNEPLLGLLKSVYVESTDPAAAGAAGAAQVGCPLTLVGLQADLFASVRNETEINVPVTEAKLVTITVT